MAFKTLTIRWPEEYVDGLKHFAGEDDESQGYILQQAFYAMNDGSLPPPRRRDRQQETHPENEKKKSAKKA